MLALALEGLTVVELFEARGRSRRDHDTESINRGPRRAARNADGVFGTHKQFQAPI